MDDMLISVAPMMGRTDKHCRYFHRLISPNAILYTEMVTTGALIHGDIGRHLDYNEQEHPIVLQLGGSDPSDLAKCAKLAQEYKYDEVNLNCGCPSDRVQRGRFGACLMKESSHVATCIAAMSNAADVPITVKCRIGIDDIDSFEFLEEFATKVTHAGASKLIIHARKAWLEGLSPKENREKPPLDYARVHKLKERFPSIPIAINGGITTPSEVSAHKGLVDEVMIGRAAYSNPWLLSEIDANANETRQNIVLKILPYIENQIKTGKSAQAITCHMSGLFKGQKGAAQWRQLMSTRDVNTKEIRNFIQSDLSAK